MNMNILPRWRRSAQREALKSRSDGRATTTGATTATKVGEKDALGTLQDDDERTSVIWAGNDISNTNIVNLPTLLNLPPELHLLIASFLSYPDALTLKHTNRYFYGIVDTGVRLKIEWLVERRRLHLECPSNHHCDLGSDLRFCRGSVKLLMQRRREHFECESRPGLGCLVYGTRTCAHRRKLSQRLTHLAHIRVTLEIWWLLLACLPILACWLFIEW